MFTVIKSALGKLISLPVRRVLVAVVCIISTVASIMLGFSVRTYSISDGENTFTIRSLTSDVRSALNLAELKSPDFKILNTSVSGSVTDIKIAYTFPVFVTVGDKTTEVSATESTVAEILKEMGLNVDSTDMVEPAADTLITETAYIDFADIEYVSGSYTKTVPCKTEVIYSREKAEGTTTINQGTDGEELIEYTAKVVNGVTVETVVDKVTVLSKAVNTQKIIGTKKQAVMTSNDVKCISKITPPTPIELDKNGRPVNYKAHKTVQATAYSTGTKCSTGVPTGPGYIAVNPDIIPYGTKMYIVSSDGKYTYGYCIAADTGGFIKTRPTNVDLFMSSASACSAFGRRNVEIYILE
ncbi:MAG: DUF348 domain-containing protein [Clostridia bacterium]|nr:DUF348 domain-containing protein [Clostridia bacterium]